MTKVCHPPRYREAVVASASVSGDLPAAVESAGGGSVP